MSQDIDATTVESPLRLIYAAHFAAFASAFIATLYLCLAIGWGWTAANELASFSGADLLSLTIITSIAWFPHAILIRLNRRVRTAMPIATGSIGAFTFTLISQAVEYFVQNTHNRLSTAISWTSELILLPTYAGISLLCVLGFCYTLRQSSDNHIVHRRPA
ncbi:hypothetical protein Rcae01_01042 [Novipirellula caenicola]|uniref:Uncharacterized protein n=1 Tax=Novipirellula caenicola TaxID=1536901 RepID=A0ABP9VPC8_9BACT